MTWPGDVSLKQCTRGGLSQSLSQRVSTYCDPTIDCICTLPSIESTPSSCPLYIKVSMVRPDSWDRTIWNVIHPSKRILQRTQDKKSCTSEKTVCTSWEKESCRLPYSLPPSPNLFFFSFFFYIPSLRASACWGGGCWSNARLQNKKRIKIFSQYIRWQQLNGLSSMGDLWNLLIP